MTGAESSQIAGKVVTIAGAVRGIGAPNRTAAGGPGSPARARLTGIKLATRMNPDGRDNRMRRCAPLAIVEYVRAYGGPW